MTYELKYDELTNLNIDNASRILKGFADFIRYDSAAKTVSVQYINGTGALSIIASALKGVGMKNEFEVSQNPDDQNYTIKISGKEAERVAQNLVDSRINFKGSSDVPAFSL